MYYFIRIPVAWIIIAVQSCKLLNLSGASSAEILVSTAAILTYTLPFILHLSTSVTVSNKMSSEKDNESMNVSNQNSNFEGNKKEIENEGDEVAGSSGSTGDSTVTGMEALNVNDKWQFKANPFLILLYLVLSATATYYIYSTRLCHNVLEFISLRDPSSEQQIASCLTLWFTFAAMLNLAFYRKATLVRT